MDSTLEPKQEGRKEKEEPCTLNVGGLKQLGREKIEVGSGDSGRNKYGVKRKRMDGNGPADQSCQSQLESHPKGQVRWQEKRSLLTLARQSREVQMQLPPDFGRLALRKKRAGVFCHERCKPGSLLGERKKVAARSISATQQHKKL